MGDVLAAGGAVTAAEIIRNFGYWQQRALTQPLTVTHHGRARVMLISVEEYERLRQGAAAPGPYGDIEMLFENMKEGLVLHDASLTIVKMNRAAEAFFGVRRDEIHPGQVLPSPRHEAIRTMLRRVLQTGEILEYEADSLMFPGRRIRLRSFPYRDGLATLFVNLTEQDRLREAAAELDASKRAVAAIKRVGLGKVDLTGKLVFADSVFETLTGATAAQLANTSLIDRVVTADRDGVRQAFGLANSEGQTSVLTVGISTPEGPRALILALAPMMRELRVDGILLALCDAAR